MQRRDLLATLGLTIAAPWSASGAHPRRVGFVSGGDEKGAESFVAAMLDGLRAKGYSEPGTMTFDRLYADYATEKVPSLVAELQNRGVDLIVTHAAATPIVVQDNEGWFPPSTNSVRTRSRSGLQGISRIRCSTRPALR